MVLSAIFLIFSAVCPNPNLPPAHELEETGELVAARISEIYPEMDPTWTISELNNPADIQIRFQVWASGPIGITAWTAGHRPIVSTIYTSSALSKVHSWESSLIHEMVHALLAMRYKQGFYENHTGRWTPATDTWIESVKLELRSRECP